MKKENGEDQLDNWNWVHSERSLWVLMSTNELTKRLFVIWLGVDLMIHPENSTLVILTFLKACLYMPLHCGYLVCILFCALYADKLATIKQNKTKKLSFTVCIISMSIHRVCVPGSDSIWLLHCHQQISEIAHHHKQGTLCLDGSYLLDIGLFQWNDTKCTHIKSFPSWKKCH